MQDGKKYIIVYLDGSRLVEGAATATGVTIKLILFDAVDVDGIATLGEIEWWGGDIEWFDRGEGILEWTCTCFRSEAISRLFIILRGKDLAKFGAKWSNIASSFIISIKFALFKSSFCN